MVINGSGNHDTARVLKINKNTVISTLKKSAPHCPDKSTLPGLKPKGEGVNVSFELAGDEVEMNEDGIGL